MKAKSILVTGFKPFLGETVNPSALLIKKLEQHAEFKEIGSTLLLPVVFQESVPLLLQQIEMQPSPIILMLGQAGGRAQVCLERVALNWIETSSPDESHWTPKTGPIEVTGVQAYFTEFPLERWGKNLKDEGFPVVVSLSAGGYVCNHLYYRVLEHLSAQGRPLKACFIHVPYLPEQTQGKAADTPSLALEVQYDIIWRIIQLAISNIKN